jgi:hypothetical protein
VVRPGDTRWARRFRDIYLEVLADQGGEARCSETRKQLIRRLAAHAVIAEQIEIGLAAGEDIDIERHALQTSSLVRVAQRIGLGRMPKTVPSLAEYLANPPADDLVEEP